MIEFTVYGVAAPAGSKTAGRTRQGRTFVRDSSVRSYPWKREVAQAAGVAMRSRPLMEGPLQLEVCFYVPRPKGHFGVRGLRPSAPVYPTVKPDVTKLLRAVEDALTGVVWRDDAQVVVQHARKVYGEPARAAVTVAGVVVTAEEDSMLVSPGVELAGPGCRARGRPAASTLVFVPGAAPGRRATRGAG